MHTYTVWVYGVYIPPPHLPHSQRTPQEYPPTPYTTYIYTYPTYTTNLTRHVRTTVPRNLTHLTCPVRIPRTVPPRDPRGPPYPVRPRNNRNLNPRWQTFKLCFFRASAREGPGGTPVGIPRSEAVPVAPRGLGGGARPATPRDRQPPCLCDKRHTIRPAEGLDSKARGW